MPSGFCGQRLAVDRELLVLVDDDVAADADHALDEVLRRIHRVAEHDDVAALRVAERDDLLLDDRQPDAVGELVDQDEVADLERRPHRRRRDLERLGHERAQQEHDQQDREEALRVLDPPRLRRVGRAALARSTAGRRAQTTPVTTREQEQDQREVHCRRVGVGGRRGLCHARRAACRRRSRHRRVAVASSTCRRPAGSRGTPPAESRRCRPPSSASCRPSASRAASSCA